MIESTHRLPLIERVMQLCRNHDCQATYLTSRLYLGSQEYNELRETQSCNGFGPSRINLPTLHHYKQGTAQFLGKSVFVLVDIPYHLALA